MSPERVVLRLHDLWNTGAIEAIPDVYSPTFVAYMPKGWGNFDFVGHAGAEALIRRVRSAFPDWHEVVHETIANEDTVVTRYTSTGTNTGVFDGRPPTGRRIVVDEISIYRVEAGLVQTQWCLVDDLSFGRQLGLLP